MAVVMKAVGECYEMLRNDVLHESKQQRKDTLESAQYGLQMIFKCD